jgi:coatomer subunit zeta
VVGGADENEILLFNVILALRDSLNILLKYVHCYTALSSSVGFTVARILLVAYCFSRNSVDKRTVIENYDLVSLAIDEIVDDGIVLETDPVIVATRVSRPPAQDMSSVKGIDLSEQGLLNAWEFGKLKLGERLRQGL